jgi:hypothetical protein
MSMTMSPNQQKAVTTAQQIMEAFDLADIEHVITEHLDDKERHNLFQAVDPDYLSLEKEHRELSNRLEKMLDTEPGKKALYRYSDNWVEQGSIRELAFFYLGYAAAQRLILGRNQ